MPLNINNEKDTENVGSDRNAAGRSLVCRVCGHVWPSRKSTDPDRCPKCRSTVWSRDSIKHNICRKCGHRWISSSERSLKCPKCRTTKWDVPARKLICRKCGHEWIAQTHAPSQCPSCRTKKWKEDPEKLICIKCGRVRPKNANSRVGLCTVCDRNVRRAVCGSCGTSWTVSRGKRSGMCPMCGSHITGNKEGPSDQRHLKDISLAEMYDWDAGKLSDAAGIDPLQAEIFIGYCRNESAVSIAKRMKISLEAVIDSIMICKRLQERMRS